MASPAAAEAARLEEQRKSAGKNAVNRTLAFTVRCNGVSLDANEAVLICTIKTHLHDHVWDGAEVISAHGSVKFNNIMLPNMSGIMWITLTSSTIKSENNRKFEGSIEFNTKVCTSALIFDVDIVKSADGINRQIETKSGFQGPSASATVHATNTTEAGVDAKALRASHKLEVGASGTVNSGHKTGETSEFKSWTERPWSQALKVTAKYNIGLCR